MSPAESLPRAGACAKDGSDCRCTCGSLLARLVPGGVEVKCRRCKQTQLLPLVNPPPEQPTRGLPSIRGTP
jgi:phage FluMu protein Com